MLTKDSATPCKRGMKRPVDALDCDSVSSPKRRRLPDKTPFDFDESATANRGFNNPIDPVAFWVRQGNWPQEYFDVDVESFFARKKSSSNLSRKRSKSATTITPSDQKPRDEKSTPYKDSRYPLLLETKGSYMSAGPDIANESEILCQTLLDSNQPIPQNSVFDDVVFKRTCENIENKNEARVIQDISRLIVPSVEQIALWTENLKHLIESVNEGWNNSIPLTPTRPQPDYSVGFRRKAFSNSQLSKLSPFIGDFIAGDQSLFMATYYMYFPFLACEVKCGNAQLDIADRQNAHSMTLAVRAIVELFRLVKCEKELHRQILAFSVSHDNQSVRIYGHYPEINGKDTEYYRYRIRSFDFVELGGREKWAAYRFTKNIYDLWVPSHFKKICSAIDKLPSDLNFDIPLLPEASDSTSRPLDQESQADDQQEATPDTSFTELQGTKRRKEAAK